MNRCSDNTMTDVLHKFSKAWNDHDIDALMSFMTDDCIFESSSGKKICGERFEGKEAVRIGFSEAWIKYPDAQWENSRHFVHGDRGVSEWTFTGTDENGMRIEVNGCDLFTFIDGKISIKNSYRKNRHLLKTK